MTGLTHGALSGYISKGSEPSRAALESMADATGASIEWLVTGRGPMMASAKAPNMTDLVPLPHYDIAVGAGPGATADDEPPLLPAVYVSKRMVDSLSVAAKHLHCVEVRGDSMEPTIPNGSILVVDTSDSSRRGDGVYVLRAEEEVVVKRLHLRADGRLEVASDNKVYPPEQYSTAEQQGLYIIGRAVAIFKHM